MVIGWNIGLKMGNGTSLRKIRKCPLCGSTRINERLINGEYRIKCKKCGYLNIRKGNQIVRRIQ